MLCVARALRYSANRPYIASGTPWTAVQLVRRLVEECHFNALFIESGVYDYIHIDQALSSDKTSLTP